jgi:tetratricopeptide (TPR) repeat protein
MLFTGAPALGVENWFETGVRHLKAREFEGAIQAFSRSLETIPDDFEAYNNRGVAYSQLNQLDRALEDFSRALALKPGYKGARLNRGISFRRQGRIAAAIEDYHWLIQSAPDYVKAHQNLSWLLATCPDSRFRDGPRALALIEMLRKQNPQMEIRDNLAAALAETGEFNRAVQNQRRYVELITPTATQAILAEERYWLERYGHRQARRDQYEVMDGEIEAKKARRLLASLVSDRSAVPPKKQKSAWAVKPSSKIKPHPRKNPQRPVRVAKARFSVQVGSYSRFPGALEVVAKLKRANRSAHAFKVVLGEGKVWYRVLVGSYETAGEAKTAVQNLKSLKFSRAFYVPIRYGLAIKESDIEGQLPVRVRKLFQSHGFYPYIGTGNRWLVGAYGRKAEAQAMVRELNNHGILVEMIEL